VGWPAADDLGVAATAKSYACRGRRPNGQTVAGDDTQLRGACATPPPAVSPTVKTANAENRPESEPYRSGLLLTHPRPSAEDSPNGFVWDCRGGRAGRNLPGLALTRVRAELIAELRTRLGALAGTG
jgi:hypothetical protein